MINGCVVGIVEDNRDPDGMHRVLVRFPVDDGVKSSWCRMVTPMGGANRGLVMLPDVGTEVLLSRDGMMVANPSLIDEYLMRRWRHWGRFHKMFENHFRYAECLRKWIETIHPHSAAKLQRKIIP